MEESSLKKKTRKIYNPEFNDLNRTSLVAPSAKTESGKHAVTKKTKKLSYLPKVHLDNEPVKENCSPNVIEENLTKKTRKKSRASKKNRESNESEVRCTRSGTSTEEDKRDSEVEFKKKKKRRKPKGQSKSNQESFSDVLSEKEIQDTETNKHSVTNSTSVLAAPQVNGKIDNEDTRNNKKSKNSKAHKSTMNCTSESYLERTTRQNSVLKANKSFSGCVSESPAPKLKTVESKTRKSKNSVLKDHQPSTRSTTKKSDYTFDEDIHTSESLAPTPLSSDGLSDDVFGENVNMSETLELRSVSKYRDNRENLDKKSFTFDISEIPIAKESPPSNKSMNTAGKRSVRFTSQSVLRRSKSLDSPLDISNKQSTFMTPDKNRSKKSAIKQAKSLNASNKRSVSFASVDSRRSKSSHEGESSKIYAKSPYISRASKTSMLNRTSESFDEMDLLQNESFPKTPEKYYSLRKPTNNSFEISDKKSVSFFTPASKNKTESKASFKKSPYVHRSTIDNLSESESDNSLNGTFQLSSPTIELEALKNKCILSLTPMPSKTCSANLTKKSIINLVTPSPQSEHHERKTSNSSSYSIQNLLSKSDDSNKTAGSSEGNKSDIGMKVTKRKHWNRSLGVSILDNLGTLHNISSPWGNETNDFDCIDQDDDPGNSFISPIRKISPAKKVLLEENSSTEESTVGKKTQENLDKSSSEIHPEIVISEYFSPIQLEESTKKLFEFQQKPSTSKLENKVAVKRTKLPNFALIHQRAFEKMEDLQEMNQRKAARAQQLLSGKKPGPGTNVKIPPSGLTVNSPTLKIKSPKSRKLLRYSLKKRQSLENAKIQKLQSPTATITVVKTQTKITPSTSNAKKIVKPVQKKVVKSSHIPKPVHLEKKPPSKVGFKAGPVGKDKVSRQEYLKAAANKTQPKGDSLEARRNVIQNVRTNRRFELLMKMRNKN